ncbi:Hypothetical predicted protein [Pelobates cultripes]|uniref:Uncharacterized protein n=1 Tax=Pelobates cultripes TaxID=61616 RepID=A0AAD1S880_PELCU|nr:Hypothetical predicted protein [Pelobates cultripes]
MLTLYWAGREIRSVAAAQNRTLIFSVALYPGRSGGSDATVTFLQESCTIAYTSQRGEGTSALQHGHMASKYWAQAKRGLVLDHGMPR